MAFSAFVGNQATVAEAKRLLPLSRMTVVVGAPSTGKTTFVACLERHFESTTTFVRPDVEGVDDLRQTLWSVATRRQGVMEAFASGREFEATTRDVRIVIDDVDAREPHLESVLEEVLAGCGRHVGVVLVVDRAGIRKLSLLKKKGALVLHLAPPGKDAVQRWARRAYLPDSASEDEIARLRDIMRAGRMSISRIKKAYAAGQTVADVEGDIAAAGAEDLDNSAALVELFSRRLDVSRLMDVVCMEGGSMMGQLAWHNAPGVAGAGYPAALRASLPGMALERDAHLKHDPLASAVGHALSLAPYAGLAPRAERGAMSYTATIAHGAARAVARRTLAGCAPPGVSVAEHAWEVARAPPASKPRRRVAATEKRSKTRG